MIAALYVQRGGCYYGIADVDPWPGDRGDPAQIIMPGYAV